MRRTAAEAEETRARILACATEAFARDGVAGVALEDVVAAAGVTRGALYHHFSDKRALFAAVTRELVSALEQAVSRAATQDDADEALRAALTTWVRGATKPEYSRVVGVDGAALALTENGAAVWLGTSALAEALARFFAARVATTPESPRVTAAIGATKAVARELVREGSKPSARARGVAELMGLFTTTRAQAAHHAPAATAPRVRGSRRASSSSS